MAKKNRRTTSKTQLIPQYRGGFIDRAGRSYSEEEGKQLLADKKATLAQWHGTKRDPNKVSYEGGQYEGGRKEGRKNLKKVDGGVINQHGVMFTLEEKKALEYAANAANRKRMKMLQNEGNLPRFVGGKATGEKVGVMQSMGKESDFIISRKSKSLQRFKTKEDYKNYMDSLKVVNSPTYIDDRTRLYKRNHMKAIENVFGEEAKDILMKIRMMKPAEYRQLIQSDEMLEVNYVYDPSARSGKLNQIRASLGMNMKEDDYDEGQEI